MLKLIRTPARSYIAAEVGFRTTQRSLGVARLRKDGGPGLYALSPKP